ncbi:hypothetical protein COT50_03835 [candidate division WWE3 bacterium CG08_land_8_20_14_0_20_41_10]|uniref:DUF3048 domain-containing protein n=1 Tax=candidate division WWE3 bacterium CG08_land_8_20_14_0_20_41_10 TaxID=1975085 RepID=A0A2H0XB00_UNCKA|nr:MAG: hypothetical protein COT50_03835 [candidate division WWE3 bacterium CG08_land_8_20_14_0_20_41_10]
MQDAAIVEQPQFINPQKLPVEGQSIGKKYVLAGLVVGLAVAGATLFLTQLGGKELWTKRISIFGQIGKDSTPAKPQEVVRPIQNSLTGVMYTKEESKDWKDLRPLGVMINNHESARPQAGLTDADFTYEVVAEGGITRFLAFYQSILPDKVGPVRSTREYYLVLTKEMGDAMLMHYGYSPQAKVAMDNWSVRSLEQGGIESAYCADCIWRDPARVAKVAWEHTLYANAKKVVKRGLDLGWDGKPDNFYVWQFKDDAGGYSLMPKADKVSYDFWYPGDFSAMWQYDSLTNSYLRFVGFDSVGKEVAHVDELTGKQISVKNVIVQFATENRVVGDEKNRLDYVLVGSGKGYVFLDGKVIEVTWSKAGRDARTKYYDANGEEIKFNRGKFWVAILPDRSPENLKFSSVDQLPK